MRSFLFFFIFFTLYSSNESEFFDFQDTHKLTVILKDCFFEQGYKKNNFFYLSTLKSFNEFAKNFNEISNSFLNPIRESRKFFHYLEKYSIQKPIFLKTSTNHTDIKKRAFSSYKDMATIPLLLEIDYHFDKSMKEIKTLYDTRKKYRQCNKNNQDLILEIADEVDIFKNININLKFFLNNKDIFSIQNKNTTFFFDFDSATNQFNIDELNNRKNYVNTYEVTKENDSSLHFIQFPENFDIKTFITPNKNATYIISFQHQLSKNDIKRLKSLNINIGALLIKKHLTPQGLKYIQKYFPKTPIISEIWNEKLRRYTLHNKTFNSIFFISNNKLRSNIEDYLERGWLREPKLWPTLFLSKINNFLSLKLFNFFQIHRACHEKIISQKKLEKYGEKIINKQDKTKFNFYEVIIVALYVKEKRNFIFDVVDNYLKNMRDQGDFLYPFYRTFLSSLYDESPMDNMLDETLNIIKIFFENKAVISDPTMALRTFLSWYLSRQLDFDGPSKRDEYENQETAYEIIRRSILLLDNLYSDSIDYNKIITFQDKSHAPLLCFHYDHGPSYEKREQKLHKEIKENKKMHIIFDKIHNTIVNLEQENYIPKSNYEKKYFAIVKNVYIDLFSSIKNSKKSSNIETGNKINSDTKIDPNTKNHTTPLVISNTITETNISYNEKFHRYLRKIFNSILFLSLCSLVKNHALTQYYLQKFWLSFKKNMGYY